MVESGSDIVADGSMPMILTMRQDTTPACSLPDVPSCFFLLYISGREWGDRVIKDVTG